MVSKHIEHFLHTMHNIIYWVLLYLQFICHFFLRSELWIAIFWHLHHHTEQLNFAKVIILRKPGPVTKKGVFKLSQVIKKLLRKIYIKKCNLSFDFFPFLYSSQNFKTNVTNSSLIISCNGLMYAVLFVYN